MRRIAITGGIAEGKSTVAGYLRDLGVRTVSSDDVAREVFDTPEIQDELRSLLGAEGPIERRQLRNAIATDPSLRRKVNQLMHPRVIRRLRACEAQAVEVPLLIEACMQGEFDRIWVVTCGPEEQLRRLSERLGSQTEASQLIATQLASVIKCAFADVIVRTNQPEQTVVRCVSEALRAEIG